MTIISEGMLRRGLKAEKNRRGGQKLPPLVKRENFLEGDIVVKTFHCRFSGSSRSGAGAGFCSFSRSVGVVKAATVAVAAFAIEHLHGVSDNLSGVLVLAGGFVLPFAGL